MAKRRASPRKRREQKDVLITTSAFAGGILIVGLVVWGLVLSSREVQRDKKTYCPVGGAESVTAVLIDLSEPYNATQSEVIMQSLEAVRDSIEIDGKIAVYILSDAKNALPDPDFAYCTPPKDGNFLIENPDWIKQKWQDSVGSLGKIVEGMIADKSGRPTSPIMEMIQVVAVKEFRKSSSNPPREKTLIVVSDMIQHSHGYSHYRVDRPDFAAFKKTPHYQKVRTDLAGAEVRVLLVRRDGAGGIQTQPFFDFWWTFLEDMGGNPRIERIWG